MPSSTTTLSCQLQDPADERAATVVWFLERALAFFAEHEVTVRRVMTDNAWAYIQFSAPARAARPA